MSITGLPTLTSYKNTETCDQKEAQAVNVEPVNVKPVNVNVNPVNDMRTPILAARAAEELPRSTAYYYADLERLKRKNPDNSAGDAQNPDELSEYVESNEVVNDGPIREVPPLRDRQWSLPEYSTPENSRRIEDSRIPDGRKGPEETYSTAGTFPMPEPKEKEPLLAELEVVGRVPLTQLETASGVRRSRSWYLCCPNVPDEEVSRESSWRYSSLRPVTAPPAPGQNGAHWVATHSSGRADDAATLRAERDALARALAAERARAASAARAHDARLAELHGVIAELVRRRARDKCARAIPEEEVSDECESTTQPAGELENDADHSRTDQNDTSSQLSVEPEPRLEPRPPDDSTDNSAQEPLRSDAPAAQECDSSLQLSERDSQLCLTTARCCQSARHAHAPPPAPGSAGSCDREHGSADGARVYTASPGRCSSRQAKLASRVRLRRTDDAPDTPPTADDQDQQWSSCTAAAAERLALDVCAHADLREALVSAGHDGEALWARLALWRARSARLEADCRVLHCALARATDTAHRLSCACAVQESWCVALCEALRAADRALEAYDVLLALAETTHRTAQPDQQERAAAELVARQVLGRLESPPPPAMGEPLLAPGPWLQRDQQCACAAPWDSAAEARLRSHAARLKADTVALRKHQPPPGLFSYHDIEEEELPAVGAGGADMEAAVMMQEVLAAREARAAARAAELDPDASPPAQAQPVRAHALKDADLPTEHKNSTGRLRRRRERHWLDAASETDL